MAFALSSRPAAIQSRVVAQRVRPTPLSLRSVRMGASSSSMATEESFDAASKIKFVLDASANGCTGMYWRSKPDMGASVSAPDWPRNGAQLEGWKSVQHPGWVKVDHPKAYWLPIEQYGKPVIHFK